MEWCLYILIFSFPFSKAIVEVSANLAILAWILKKAMSLPLIKWRELKFGIFRKFAFFSNMNLALAVFLVVCLFSVIASGHFGLSLRSFIRKTLEYAVIFLIAVETIDSKRRLRNILVVMLASAAMIGLDAVVQYGRHVDLLRNRPLYAHRITGPFETPNDLGAYLIIPLSVSISLFLSKLKTIKVKILLGALSFFLMMWLIETVSRSAWVGLFAAVLYISIFGSKKKILVYFVGSLLIIFPLVSHSMKYVSIGVPNVKERLCSIFTLSDLSSIDRKEMWQGSWKMFKDRPIIGHGLNTFMSNYRKYSVDRTGAICYAHNGYLQMAAETGVIGLGAFLWFILSLLWKSTRCIKKIGDSFYRAAMIGLVGSLVAFLVNSGLDTSMYSLPLVMAFWCIMGLTVGLRRAAIREGLLIESTSEN